jgi:hypothetical protein
VRLGKEATKERIELSKETLARDLRWLLGEPDDRFELIVEGLVDMRARRAEEEQATMAAARERAAKIVQHSEEQREILRQKYPDGAPQVGSGWGAGAA